MYEAFFELKEKPFSLLPDPDFLFLSSKHAVALSMLEYSLAGQAGFCVISGEVGSGKTTLIRALLRRIGRDIALGLISNTHSTHTDIVGWALMAFGQRPAGQTPADRYQELMHFLIGEYGSGRRCVLIVDEAQNLTVDALEELRLLSNINSGKDLLLQVALVGQPELLEKLKRPELRQFAQRINVSYHLSPLSSVETATYIRHRLRVAGAQQPIFTEMAIGGVHCFSGGVPRLINAICDMALVYAFADGKVEVDLDTVVRVIADRQATGVAPFAINSPAELESMAAEIARFVDEGTRSTPVERVAGDPTPADERTQAASSDVGQAPSPSERIEPQLWSASGRENGSKSAWRPIPELRAVRNPDLPAAANTALETPAGPDGLPRLMVARTVPDRLTESSAHVEAGSRQRVDAEDLALRAAAGHDIGQRQDGGSERLKDNGAGTSRSRFWLRRAFNRQD